MELRIALSHEDVLQCQELIAETYNDEYGVVFSDDDYDLDGGIERWPHRYLMGIVARQVVASAGLYVRDTYVENFGNVSDEEIDILIRHAGAAPQFSAARKREITKVVVRKGFRGRGYGSFFLGCAHARDFLQVDTEPDAPEVLVCCARRSIWDALWHGAGIRTRPIKDFPLYRVHERYRSPADRMDSRLVVPPIDVPRHWLDRAIPGEYEVTRRPAATSPRLEDAEQGADGAQGVAARLLGDVERLRHVQVVDEGIDGRLLAGLGDGRRARP
jgi:GNAT superfamily N-acetyltransferase